MASAAAASDPEAPPAAAVRLALLLDLHSGEAPGWSAAVPPGNLLRTDPRAAAGCASLRILLPSRDGMARLPAAGAGGWARPGPAGLGLGDPERRPAPRAAPAPGSAGRPRSGWRRRQKQKKEGGEGEESRGARGGHTARETGVEKRPKAAAGEGGVRPTRAAGAGPDPGGRRRAGLHAPPNELHSRPRLCFAYTALTGSGVGADHAVSAVA